MDKFNGFSLVELMVVIAIVSLLAAIAAPTYTKYTVKTQIDTLMQVIQNNFEKAETHYQRYGWFPAAGAYNSGDGVGLGYTTPSDWREVGSPSTEISPLLSDVWLGSQPAGGGCNTYAYYQYFFNPVQFSGGVVVASDNINYFIGEKLHSPVIVIGCDTTIGGVTVAGGDANYVKCQYSYAQAHALSCP